MKKTIIIALSIGCFLNSSCEKEEIPVLKPQGISANTQVEMGADYANQLFFNIENHQIVLANNRESWDLAFECGNEGKHLLINSAKFSSCAKTNETDLLNVTASEGLVFNYDHQSGFLDSTAVGNWWEDNSVYVLNKGVDLNGNQLGFIKFKMVTVDQNQYEIHWSELNSNNILSTLIPKSSTTNFVYFSFVQNQTLQIEPDKNSWQLCFTTYTHIFPDHTPYLVCGVLSNRNNVQVSKSTIPFSDFTYSQVSALQFDTKIDNIGYTWKEYDFDQGLYVVNSNLTYIIKNQNNQYFKLRFTDFYTISGVKGAPQFEIEELIP